MLDIRVSLDVAEINDPAELERLHRRLRTYLERSELERVRPVRSTEAVEGGRGVQEFLFGAFQAVVVKSVTAVAAPFARALADFVSRSGRSVSVEIDGDKLTIDRPSGEQVEKILTQFLEHHRKDD